MSLQAQLKKAKALWKEAKKKKPDFDTVLADGVYVGKITHVEIGESQASGRLQVGWRATVSVGESKGENIRWYNGLKTEDNFMYLQRDIARLGKDVPEDVSEIEDVLAEITKEKPAIRFKVITNGEFTNVRVLKALDEEEAPEDNDEESEEPEEPEEPENEEDVEKDEEEEGDEEEDSEDSDDEEAEEDDEEDEEDEEDEDDSSPELSVGTRVVFKLKGKDVAGEVKKLDNKAEEAKVKTDAGPTYRVKFEKLAPEPKTKVKKKKK